MYLFRYSRKGLTGGRIVEAEAYESNDPASHSYRGISPRNGPMFGPPGRAYVYFVYGNYYCFNVVTGPCGDGAAVLIRALEPFAGEDIMMKRRGRNPMTSGPGRLCQAMAISNVFNFHPLWESPLWLERGIVHPDETIAASPRIGISKGRNLNLRFYLSGNRYVSR